MPEMQSILMGIAATAALATPVPLAIIADRQVKTFEMEAFGHFRAAARRLRSVGWAFFTIQYVAVAGFGLTTGAVAGMFRVPLNTKSLAMYGLMASVALVYTFALGVSRALYNVTKAREIVVVGQEG